jgi:hypothetical protein
MGIIVCSDEAGVSAGCSIATGRVTKARWVSTEEPNKESPTTRGTDGSLGICQTPKEARLKIKVCPSMLGVQHATDNLILEEMIMLESPKRENKAKLNSLEC